MMTRFQRWLLKRLCKELVAQGPHHKNNIIEYFTLMRQAARHEFREDTNPSLDSFLDECFTASRDRA